MSYARLNDGSIFHFPVLTGSTGIIDVPPEQELARTVGELKPSSIPLFTKSLLGGVLKRRHAVRYAKVNRARLILARTCIDRMLAESEPEPEAA